MDIGNMNMYTSYITNQASTEKTKESLNLKNDYASATDDELMDACKQFEAYFWSRYLKK